MSLGMHGRSGARPLQPTNTLLHPLWRLRGQPHYRALRCHRRRSRRQRPENDQRHSRCTRRPRCHSRRRNSCCRRHGCCRCCTLVRGPISCRCGCCGRHFTTSHSRPAHAAATRAAADDDATWVRAQACRVPTQRGIYLFSVIVGIVQVRRTCTASRPQPPPVPPPVGPPRPVAMLPPHIALTCCRRVLSRARLAVGRRNGKGGQKRLFSHTCFWRGLRFWISFAALELVWAGHALDCRVSRVSRCRGATPR